MDRRVRDAGRRSKTAFPRGISKALVDSALFWPLERLRFWRALWALADEKRSRRRDTGDQTHYLWQGEIDRGGEPVFSLRGERLLARALFWAWDGGQLGRGEGLRPTCRYANCVRAEHQELVPRTGRWAA